MFLTLPGSYKTTLNGSSTSESALQWKLRREFGVRSQESPCEVALQADRYIRRSGPGCKIPTLGGFEQHYRHGVDHRRRCSTRKGGLLKAWLRDSNSTEPIGYRVEDLRECCPNSMHNTERSQRQRFRGSGQRSVRVIYLKPPDAVGAASSDFDALGHYFLQGIGLVSVL